MIEVVNCDPDDRIGERCCFCRSFTVYWCEERDVACCKKCAQVANLKDVPAKKTWLRREDIATYPKPPGAVKQTSVAKSKQPEEEIHDLLQSMIGKMNETIQKMNERKKKRLSRQV